MPLPVLLAVPAAVGAAGTAGAAVYATLTSEVVQGRVRRIVQKLGPDFVQNAVDNLGIDLNVEDGLNDESITNAINKTFLSGAGFQLTSVFDGDKLKSGLIKQGIEKIIEGLNIGGSTTIAGVSISLEEFITAEAIGQLARSAGEIYDAAKESKRIKAIIEQQRANAEKPKRNVATDMSEHGKKNRERQATYRASHTKIWVERGGA